MKVGGTPYLSLDEPPPGFDAAKDFELDEYEELIISPEARLRRHSIAQPDQHLHALVIQQMHGTNYQTNRSWLT